MCSFFDFSGDVINRRLSLVFFHSLCINTLYICSMYSLIFTTALILIFYVLSCGSVYLLLLLCKSGYFLCYIIYTDDFNTLLIHIIFVHTSFLIKSKTSRLIHNSLCYLR